MNVSRLWLSSERADGIVALIIHLVRDLDIVNYNIHCSINVSSAHSGLDVGDL